MLTNASADQQSSIVTGTAYSPTSGNNETAVGGSILGSMSAACDKYKPGSYAALTAVGQCSIVQADGNTYACYTGAGTNQVWEGCAGYSVYDCANGSQDSCNGLPRKNNGCSDNDEGNPCNVATGNKHHTLTIATTGSIDLTLTYNSQDYSNTDWFGERWISNHSLRAYYLDEVVFLIRGNGSGERWERINGVWAGDADSKRKLTDSPTNLVTFYDDAAGGTDLIVTNPDGSLEIYGDIEFTGGKLYQTISAQGAATTYSYDRRKIYVRDQYGNQLMMERGSSSAGTAANKVQYIRNGDGKWYTLEYGPNQNLKKIIYPDITPSDPWDNPTIQFHYEDTNFPKNLTGITDENGDRYSTYAYDSLGRAISTAHSQTTNTVGQEKFELDYQ